MRKADRYYSDLGHGSFGGGNIKYGLSTIEEKSLGAYAKSGTRPIAGMLKPGGDRPTAPGLYLMDTVNDGPVRYGIPNINDTQTITEMVASGCHLIVFTTSAGSVVGRAVAPVLKGVSNLAGIPAPFRRHRRQWRHHRRRRRKHRSRRRRIVAKVVAMARGEPSKSPRGSATRNSSCPTRPMSRSDRLPAALKDCHARRRSRQD